MLHSILSNPLPDRDLPMHAQPLLCSMCRAPLASGKPYLRCTVASCNAGRLKLRFCSVACFQKHIPTARHRQASWVEETAP